jgi:GT2 family glycosyltransferase
MTGYLKAYQRGTRERDLGQYDDEVQVFSASGAACLWRRAALERIGLLDESFFAYYEDVDLGFRARLVGYECWYAPRAVVRHAGAGTSSLSSEFVYFHSVKNRWGMILKDVPAPLLVRNALKIVFGELLALAWCVREGHLHFMLGAYKEILGSLRPLLAKRRQVQASRTISLAELDAVINPKYPPPRSHRALLRLLQ